MIDAIENLLGLKKLVVNFIVTKFPKNIEIVHILPDIFNTDYLFLDDYHDVKNQKYKNLKVFNLNGTFYNF